jgi:glycosyltransferase involved in cell wall biosynthesis
MAKKRLLFTYLFCNKGGVTSVIKNRLPALMRDGWVVDAAFQQDVGGGEELQKMGLSNLYLFPFAFEAQLKALIEETPYDVIVNIDAPSALAEIKKVFSGPLIYEIHTSIVANLRKNTMADFATADRVFVPSDFIRTTLMDLFPDVSSGGICVIPNFVPEGIFTTQGPVFPFAGPTLLWVGKLFKEKNWKEALAISGQLMQRQKNLHVCWVTGGAYDEKDIQELLQHINSAGGLERFQWLHNVDSRQMGTIYRGAAESGGFLLSSSRYESFCLVAHEAMRCGLPVVSTRVGPVLEIIDDGQSGFLYDSGQVSRAVEKGQLLLQDAGLRRTMAQNALSALAPFGQEELARTYLETLGCLIG